MAKGRKDLQGRTQGENTLKDTNLIIDTINNLSGRMDKMSSEMNQRFDAVDSRLDAVDNRLDAVDNRLDAVDNRLDAVEKRLDDVEEDLIMVRYEVQSESGRIYEKIKETDDRVHDLQMLAQEKWNVPELEDRLDVVELVVTKHSDQIKLLNEKTGVAG